MNYFDNFTKVAQNLVTLFVIENWECVCVYGQSNPRDGLKRVRLANEKGKKEKKKMKHKKERETRRIQSKEWQKENYPKRNTQIGLNRDKKGETEETREKERYRKRR